MYAAEASNVKRDHVEVPRGGDETRQGEGQGLYEAEPAEGQAGLPVLECPFRPTTRRWPAVRTAERVGSNLSFVISVDAAAEN